jgi:hypothetical protein
MMHDCCGAKKKLCRVEVNENLARLASKEGTVTSEPWQSKSNATLRS